MSVFYQPSVTPLLFILCFSSDPPQALLPHHNNEPAGWWMGTLVKSKGEVRHITTEVKVNTWKCRIQGVPSLCERGHTGVIFSLNHAGFLNDQFS